MPPLPREDSAGAEHLPFNNIYLFCNIKIPSYLWLKFHFKKKSLLDHNSLSFLSVLPFVILDLPLVCLCV